MSTQKQVADRVGVSVMTVSRALRGKDGVGEDLRRKIVQQARKLGVRNPAGGRNGSARPHLNFVCSMVSDDPDSDEAGFHARIRKGLRLAACELDVDIANHDDDVTEWPRIVRRGQVDGVIAMNGGDKRWFSDRPSPVPFVTIFCEAGHSDVVTVDNTEGAAKLGDYLGEMGHRSVAFIGPDTPIARERLIGLRLGLEAHGGSIPAKLVHMLPHAGGIPSVDRLVDGVLPPHSGSSRSAKAPFTALAAYNDYMAAEAIRRLEQRGIYVPDDLSVTGFDGAIAAVGLRGREPTTSAIPLEELGAEALRLLYWRLETPHAPQRRLVLKTSFVKGNTVRAIPR